MYDEQYLFIRLICLDSDTTVTYYSSDTLHYRLSKHYDDAPPSVEFYTNANTRREYDNVARGQSSLSLVSPVCSSRIIITVFF